MGLNLKKIMDLMIDWVENPQKTPKNQSPPAYIRKKFINQLQLNERQVRRIIFKYKYNKG